MLKLQKIQRVFLEMDEKNPQAAITAFDRNLTSETLCRTVCFLRPGIPGYATRSNVFCPTGRNTCLVECGVLIKGMESTTNTKPGVLGKPDSGLLKMVPKRCGVNPHQSLCLMTGDRLGIDNTLDRNAATFTCWALSSESDRIPMERIIPDYRSRSRKTADNGKNTMKQGVFYDV